jgi:hypothetical protein
MTGSLTIKLGSSGGGSSAWGGITGTLSNQTDLQTALNLKANLASPTFTGIVTTEQLSTTGLIEIFGNGVTGGLLRMWDADNSNWVRFLTPASVDSNVSYTLPTTSGTLVTNGANTFTALQQFTGTTHAGLRLNNLTTVERDAVASPQAGMCIWNTTAARLQLHNGSAWTAGMVRLDGDTMTGALSLPVGSVAATSLNFGTAGTGIYSASSGINFSIAGSLRWAIDSSGTLQGSNNSIQTTGNAILSNTYLRLDGPALRMGASDDVAIGRDGAAETLALGRRNTSANTFRIYGTYTDASNYVRLALTTTSTTMGIVCQTAGTGADDIDLGLTPAGTGLLALSTAASADVAVASTHSVRMKFNGTEYKVLLATP